MSRNLQNALDDCLARLERGEGLEACLGRYPRLRGQLSPLLQAAQSLYTRRDAPPMGADALERVRLRVLAAASTRQPVARSPRALRSRSTPTRTRLSAFPRWGLSRAFVTVASVILLIVGILGGGGIVSANSLPGDPLYGIKRTSERVRLALALGDEQRALLEQRFEELRLREVKEVVEQHREVEVDFAGPVEQVDGDTITVQGIAVRLSPQALLSAPPDVGTIVNVVAITQVDGSVEASLIAVEPREPSVAETVTVIPTATASPDPQQRPTHTATQRPTATVVKVAQPTDVPPTALPTTAPTNSPLPSSTQPVPTQKPTATQTGLPTAVPSPTSAPPPREVKVRIEGLISEIKPEHWVVDGQRIALVSSTQLNQAAAQAQVGGWAIAHAVIEPDGRLVAREFIVVRGPQVQPEPQEFSGIVEAHGEAEWRIAGRLVWITPQTAITGTPQVGALAHVKAERHSDGRVVALKIDVETVEIVQFAGIIEELESGRWVVSGQVVLILGETEIEGAPVVGAIAEIEAVLATDGTLTARRARIDTSTLQGDPLPTEATPTPTADGSTS